MRRTRTSKTLFLLVGIVIVLLVVFLIKPLDDIGLYCTHVQLPNEKCMCIHSNISAHAYFDSSPRVARLHEIQHDNNAQCLMTIKPQGRLGNLMGEYATLYALAKLNGRPGFIDSEMHLKLRQYFNLSLPVLHNGILSRIPWKIEELNDWMESEYASLNSPFIKLKGYPCSWTFYHNIRDEIVREFTFHSHLTQQVHEYLSQIRGNRSSVTFVGVHIRRGDYVKLMGGTYKGVLADASYLAEAMRRIQLRYRNAMFVVCSDDLDWAKQNIDTTKYSVVFGWSGKTSSAGLDMALLSACNHSIMTIGTYGYWSSYLAGGNTIYLSNFTQPTSVFLKVFKYDTAFLPRWEGIEADMSLYSPSSSNVLAAGYVGLLFTLLVALCSLVIVDKIAN